MRPKRSLHSCNSGTTLMELMVTTVIGGLIAAFVINIALTNRSLYQKDLGRTRVNQNLRSAIDIIGSDIRQAGERLPASFPAIEIVDGVDGAPDELIVRRNLLNEVLVVCEDLNTGGSETRLDLSSDSASTPVCTYPSQSVNTPAWELHRADQPNQKIHAYLYHQSEDYGEFIEYTGANNNGSSLWASITQFSPDNDYPAEFTSLYVLVEWRYRVLAGVLQVVENRDEANALNVVDGVTDFQVVAVMQNGALADSFDSDDKWANLRAVRISVSGSERSGGTTPTERSLTGDFFPRNVLSQ